MNFNLYQELSKRTMPKVWDDLAKCNYSMGLSGEAGELVDLMKKEIHHEHPEDRVAKKKEVGDILHYLAGICTMYGFTLEEAATLNLIKLQERYPDGFKSVDSIRRVDVKR